ncbi:archaeoflavoprotein AfpA [Pseudodesulfovibrio sp. JC047]|uniref:archaeoflavoprotein AfpA n=1 Tax=Pseudodesulfovibrio sp. JC047 TaxID=2683199 RepID=UPI0013D69B58|nr:archaeoflavoprotein AfpA [Pseudodesulfovibrio sp. JC047]NDV19438.1 archaeoflavoprotein AfpA [Pseudodesulfovibrio sp. JC047]
MKIVWGITGAGDLMPELIDIMSDVSHDPDIEITAVLSKAAHTVIHWYKLTDRLKSIAKRVCVEKDANTPFIAGPIQVGKYDLFLAAPLTANSTAKIAHGIADSLITNCVAQACKGDTPTYLLPVDRQVGTTTTTLPDGTPFTLKIRPVDVANVEILRTMDDLHVLEGLDDLRQVLAERLGRGIGGTQ